MSNPFERYQIVANGLLLLVKESKSYVDENLRRLNLMHRIYIEQNSSLYSQPEIDWIDHYLRSVCFKYNLVAIGVEQLQAVRHNKIDEEILSALENSLDRLNCSDDEQLLVSSALECVLFQARAFLDIYMLQVCLLLRTGFDKGHMNKERFFDELSNVQTHPFAEKARWVEEYFRSRVYNEGDAGAFIRNDWGELVRSLRDRIAHRDVLRPSSDSQETLIQGILLDWPTLQRMTYHSFCEMIIAGMYFLFYDVSSFLYDSNWDDFSRS